MMYKKVIEKVVNVLLDGDDYHVATWYGSPKEVVTATRVLYNGRIPSKSATRIDIRLKIGRPNYLERKFIKDCQKAGEPFPIKKILVKFPPKKRKK